MVTAAPEQERERWISPHALLGATSVGSAGMTTAGLLAGPAGVATVAAAGVLAAGGVAAVRRFAPGAAEKLGLRKPDRDKKTDSKDKSKSDKKKTVGSGSDGKGGGLGRLGLLGGNRKKGTGGAGGGTKRGAGLLGVARKVAGKGLDVAKRATAAGKKGAGLLGGKNRPSTAGNGRGGSGAPSGGKSGRSRSGGGNGAGRGGSKNSPSGGGKQQPGSGKSSGRGWGSRIGRTAAGLVGWGARRLFGPKRPDDDRGTQSPAGDKPGKKPKDRKTKGPKGSGLLGGGKDKNREPKGKKDKPTRGKKTVPPGRDPRRGITAGQPDRNGRRTHGGPTMPDPFASRREAISGAAPLEIERANDVIDYITHAPDYAEAQARRWLNEADTIVDKVDLNQDFTDALKDFANAQLQQVQKVREFGETFRRSHSDRLSKLQRKDPREAMWDVDRNRD